MLTGRLSLAAQPWLADHRSAGWCCFPVPVLWSWSSAPLTRSAAGSSRSWCWPRRWWCDAGRRACRMQVVVGRRRGVRQPRGVGVFPARSTRSGVVTARRGHTRRSPAARGFGGSVGVAAGRCGKRGHFRTAMRGWRRAAIEYGPAFQGLVAIWRRGPELFARPPIPPRPAFRSTGWGCIRPCWMRVSARRGLAVETNQTMLPFCWRGVSLHAGGAGRVRARFSCARCGCDVGRDGRCHGIAGADGALAGDPPDERRAAADRGDDGCRPHRRGPLEVVWSPISSKPTKLTGQGCSRRSRGRNSGRRRRR